MDHCRKCIRSLDDVGIAQELYSVIADDYASTRMPVSVSCKWSQVTKYLETNGYIITHESNVGDIHAVPTDRCERK